MKFNMLGDANHAGPVRLSDVYSSAVGSAKDGVAASQRALYDAYNSLNSSFSTLGSRFGNFFGLKSWCMPQNGKDNNRLKITVARSPYMHISGFIFTRYAVHNFTVFQDGNANLNCSAKNINTMGDTLTTSVSSYTAMFKSSSNWNDFGVIYITATSSQTFAVDLVT